MTPQKWGLLKNLFSQAVAMEWSAQVRFVEAVKRDNPEIESSLRSLLRHHDTGATLLNGPLISQDRIIEYLSAGVRTFQNGEIVTGRFRIQKFVGQGGMGEVYAAEDLDLGECIALKTLRPKYSSDTELLQRFKREIQIARRVTHPNVCRVFDLFWHRDQPDGTTIAFLTMELLEGETLEDRLHRGGRFRESDALPLLEQIVSGLAAAHAAGIIHRDLKSANILLVNRALTARAVITDFGLARTLDSEYDPTPREGTPAYLAPEQIDGRQLTRLTDIYALGVVLFEMMTGTLPFEGASCWQEAASLRVQPPSPRSVVPTLNVQWEAVILACMDHDPAKRPPSAESVLSGINDRGLSRRVVVGALAATAASVASAVVWLRPRKINPEALRSFKRGEDFAQRRNAEGLRNAVEEFRRAVSLEPNYAPAWVGLADVYSALGNFALIDPHQAKLSAREAAGKAVALDGNSAKAQAVYGRVISLDVREWSKAEPYFKRAVTLDPRDPTIRVWYGAHLGKLGRSKKALEQLRAGLEQAPSSMQLNEQLAAEFFRARSFDEFLNQARELVRLQPFESGAHLVLARALEWQRRFDEALASCDEAKRLRSSETEQSYRASIEAARGHILAAQKIAERLRAFWLTNPFQSALLAALFAQLREADPAVDVLNQGFVRDDSTVLTAPTNPYFDAIRNTEGFLNFLHKLDWQGVK